MKITLAFLVLFLASCSSSLNTPSQWAVEAKFPEKPQTITQDGSSPLGAYQEEHLFLEQEKFVYAAIKRSYANDISASQKEAAYDKIMRDFVKTKRTKKTLSQKNVQLGSHQGRQYRMQYDDHAGDYILVFTGRSLYLFGVETENTTLLNSSRFLQSIKVN